MASVLPRCVVCKNASSDVILFNETTLAKCWEMKRVRLKYGLKYGDVDLPSSLSDLEGYHTKCRNNLIAVMAKYLKKEEDQQASTSSLTSHQSTSAEDILSVESIVEESEEQPPTSSLDSATISYEGSARTCIFCDKARIKVKGKNISVRTTQTNIFKENLKAQATELNDLPLLKKINQNKNPSYHDSCRGTYQSKFKSFIDSKCLPTAWHTNRNYHKIAYEQLCGFIEEHVLNRRKCVSFSFLLNSYKTNLSILLRKNFEHEDDVSEPQHLKDKISKTFGRKIKIVFMHNQNILCPVDVTVDESTYLSLKKTDSIAETALTLRELIFQIKKNDLPQSPSTRDLITGECAIPEELHYFFLTLVGGVDRRRRQSVEILRKVKSLSEDTIYTVRKGQLKTSKHITLGMAIKSLTSSRKVIDILNRYGHCCSYDTVEELETEATFAATDRSTVCPQGIIQTADLCIGLAFDNFDRSVETCSGKDSLHDTVGVIFQNVGDNSEDDAQKSMDDNARGFATNAGSKRRRSLEVILPELITYPKKPKMIDVLVPIDNPMRQLLPDNLLTIKKLDLSWMLSHAFEIPNTPMWVGFNSKIISDDSPKQTVAYFTPIDVSTTETSVVVQTMIQAQKAASECKQRYVQITYDLAIAKVALQIQATEHPKFANVFIHLGSFHIMMAYFKAVGKFIDDCGLTYMMVESELLANGCVNGFISGKHFNRCKRLHPIVSLALEVMHFKAFIEHEKLEVDQAVISVLTNLQENKFSSDTFENEALMELLQKYSAHQEATLEGQHGKTAQFYMMYIKLINYYLILTRSIRMGDFELFKYILPKIANIFFAFNQPNYARWLVKYHNNLIKVDDTHPGLKEILEQGYFGVKRTDKPFSRQPIDLTLKQTMNADAARRLTGIIHFTDSISARRRWSRSHSIRSTMISHVYDETGLQKSQDITGDLERHQVRKNSADLKKFMDTVNRNINPFNCNLDSEVLYNIGTGRAAPDETATCLLNIEKAGTQLRETFISECAASDCRFEKPIKRNAILNFSLASHKELVKIGSKVQEIRMQRDLFGRLLGVSMEQNIDVAKVLTYPLTPIPMSMCHLDGAMCKTDKSALTKLLEKKTISQPPSHTDVVILDGFFLLHGIKDVPKTFGNISKKILQMVTRFSATTIYLVFERYCSPSIKDNERERSGGFQSYNYVISGPDQARPADFSKELRNTCFKEALVRFLIEHWATNGGASLLGTKTVYVNFDYCYCYKVVDKIVQQSVDKQLSCENHEEADTKVIYHICNIDFDANVVVECADTDILVIMLGNMHRVNKFVRIWMNIGVGNDQKYIDITLLYNNLGQSLSGALLGFHALTGCDYNPAFFGKGKSRPFTLLEKNLEFQKAFSILCNQDSSDVRDTAYPVLEKFICRMYGVQRVDDVNEARFEIFTKTFKFKDGNEPFSRRFKNVDAANLPPCGAELHQQLLRATYISSIWGNANLKTPTQSNPLDYGWTESGGKFDLLWFEGNQSPTYVNDIVIQPVNLDDEINVTDDEDDGDPEDDDFD